MGEKYLRTCKNLELKTGEGVCLKRVHFWELTVQVASVKSYVTRKEVDSYGNHEGTDSMGISRKQYRLFTKKLLVLSINRSEAMGQLEQ